MNTVEEIIGTQPVRVPKLSERARADQRESKKRYSMTEKGRAAAIQSKKNSRAKDPHKHKARMLLSVAIFRGKIIKPTECEVNKDCHGRIEGHHQDYSKPLEVNWVCRKHHGVIHNGF